MNFFKKINNNKGAGDLQLIMVCTLLIVTLALCMCIDFWNASVAKISIVKTIQSAEIYCLVKSIANDYEDLRHNTLEHATQISYDTYSDQAVTNMGDGGGKKTLVDNEFVITKKVGELYTRLNSNNYIRNYHVQSIRKLPSLGQIGMKTEMTYTTNTIIRSPEDIIPALRRGQGEDKDISTDANNEISVVVAAKLVPYTYET